MQTRDAASNIGRVVLFLPLILLFLIGADSAFACPRHNNGAAYRTKVIKNRQASNFSTTVITYRGPASHRRCSGNVVAARSARYVAVRGDRNFNDTRYVAVRRGGTRYVSVRNSENYYVPRQKRYVAVRVRDIDHAPRYIAVRREAPRVRYVAVRDIDIDDDDHRYVAVRRSPVYNTGARYVPVRNVDRDYDVSRTKYVAVRNAGNGCARAVALRSCLDHVETTSAKRVVLRSDYMPRTQEVVVNEIDDDDEYVAVPSESLNRTKYVQYTDDAYSNRNGETYVMASRNTETPCLRRVAIRTCPETLSSRTMSYSRISDDDYINDQAILDEAGTTYVASDDIEDARLSTNTYVSTPAVTTREVNYLPDDDLAYDTVQSGSVTRYAVVGNAAPHSIPYVALDADRVFNDVDPAFVEAHRLGNTSAGPVTFVALNNVDDIDDVEYLDTAAVSYVPQEAVSYMPAETVSYVPVSDMEYSTDRCLPIDDMDFHTISYVPADDIDDTEYTAARYVPVNAVETEKVMYLPADDVNVEAASYVPVSTVNNVETAYIAADACPEMLGSVAAEPMYVIDDSAVFVEAVGAGPIVGLSATQRIASQFGYSDGFEEGLEDALDGESYEPYDSGDFREATEGYEDEFGNKQLYRGVYQNSYLKGYRAGFASRGSA